MILLSTGKSFSLHDWEGFINHMAAIPVGSSISWNSLATNTFPVKCQKTGEVVKNANQVLQKMVWIHMTTTPITINSIAGRDFEQRERNCKRRMEFANGQVSIETSRPAKCLKQDIKTKIQSVELSVGEN